MKSSVKHVATYFCVVAGMAGSQPLDAGENPNVQVRLERPIVTFAGHQSEVTTLAFNSDGSRIATVSADSVCFWDAATGAELKRLASDANQITAFSSDLSHIVIANSFRADVINPLRGMLELVDANNGNQLWSINPHGDWDQKFPFRPSIAAAAFSLNGKWLATSGSVTKVGGSHGLPGGVVKTWDVASGKELNSFGPLSTRADAVAFSADGRYLAAGTQGASGELPEPGAVHLWNAATGERLHTFKTHLDVDQGGDPGSVADLKFNRSGTRVAVAVSDGTVRLLELPFGKELRELRGHQGRTSGLEVDKFTGRLLESGGSVRTVAFSPDGRQLASAGYDRVVRVWNADTGEQTKTFRFDSSRINVVAFSPDGQRLAAGGSNSAKSGVVEIWKMSDKANKTSDPVLPALQKSELAKTESEVRSQIASAVAADSKDWLELDASQRGINERVVKILTRTPALSDQQVTSAVYLLAAGRPPTDDELQQAQQAFAKTRNRPLSALQLTRSLVRGKEFSIAISAANGRLVQTQKDLTTRFLTADEYQKLIRECQESVEQAVKTDDQLVNLAFLLTLSRFPAATELNQFSTHLKQASDHTSAAKDVFLFLLNTKEFLTEK